MLQIDKTVAEMRDLHVRDYEQMLDIEARAFDDAWSPDELRRNHRLRNGYARVISLDDVVIGYTLYELWNGRIRMSRLAVDYDFRRRGVGSFLIKAIMSRLRRGGRERLVTEVRDTNLDAQLFLRDRGFRAMRILKRYYDRSDDDCYVFAYPVGGFDRPGAYFFGQPSHCAPQRLSSRGRA